MAPRAAQIRIGCSGWEYAHWRGVFYPADLPRHGWFAHYASRFDTVEINNSFYRLPQLTTVEAWRRQAPPGFMYAWKASRFLTHMRKLRDPAAPLALMFERARALGSHLGPVLYQLPPRWTPNLERLTEFLTALPRDVPHTIEFRDAAWYRDDVLDALARRGVALCLHDMVGSAPPRVALGPFTYVRFHGSSAKYGGAYSTGQLSEWADWLAGQHGKGRDVYVYFNNDIGGHAPNDARTLIELIGERLAHAMPEAVSGIRNEE
jgi:uncharacterized protein YecE (DUF72 family)